jgi:prolyl 4-hydroxylase
MTRSLSDVERARIVELARGGRPPEELVAPLLAAGWSEQEAIDAVERAMREWLDQHARENSLPASRPVPAPVGANGPAVVEAGDRHVKVLASLLYPRIVVFGGVLAERECDEMVRLARPCLTRSNVVDPATGSDMLHEARTSDSASFQRGETPLLARIERRLAALADWPLEYGEGIQVLRYGPGAQYKPHYDWFDPAEPGHAAILARGGQRVASIVMYLNTPAHGGATVFPDAGLEVAAIKGNAVFFAYDRPHPLSRSLHGGAPVHAGEKWVATKWLRESRHD